jgi:hypothetical protein
LAESFSTSHLAERLKVIWLKVKARQAVFTPARLRDDLTISLLFLTVKNITPAKYPTYFQRYYRTLLEKSMSLTPRPFY